MEKRFSRAVDLLVFYTVCLVGFALGLSYITQKDLVLETRSATEGYFLVSAVVVVVVWRLVSWMRARKTNQREVIP